MGEHAINSPIYRDIAETLNKTLFDVYVPESYTPVVHWLFLEHPEIPMIGHEHASQGGADIESDNLCISKLPLSYIVDMLVTGQKFQWKYPSDIQKADMFIVTYLNQFKGVDLSKDPQLKQLVEKFQTAHEKFHERTLEQEARKPVEQKRLSVADLIRALGPAGL